MYDPLALRGGFGRSCDRALPAVPLKIDPRADTELDLKSDAFELDPLTSVELQ